MFCAGLKRVGYRVEIGLPDKIREGDTFVTWNRIGAANTVADAFQKIGNTTLITENATWGNSFAGDRWYTLARNYHNTAGCFPVLGNDRWDSLGIELQPFRDYGETVLLPQRGIGSKPVAMPGGWTQRALKQYGGRVRRHPGKFGCIPLEEDLKDCGHVVTWGSGAAIKALMMGIKVTSEMPSWIGYQDNTETDRLRMFRELAWGQARHSEIESGEAFDRLLNLN